MTVGRKRFISLLLGKRPTVQRLGKQIAPKSSAYCRLNVMWCLQALTIKSGIHLTTCKCLSKIHEGWYNRIIFSIIKI